MGVSETCVWPWTNSFGITEGLGAYPLVPQPGLYGSDRPEGRFWPVSEFPTIRPESTLPRSPGCRVERVHIDVALQHALVHVRVRLVCWPGVSVPKISEWIGACSTATSM